MQCVFVFVLFFKIKILLRHITTFFRLTDHCPSVVGSIASSPTANTTNSSRRRRSSPQFVPRPFDSPPTKCIFCCLCHHQTLAPVGLTVELSLVLLVWKCIVREVCALTGSTDRKDRFQKVCGKLVGHRWNVSLLSWTYLLVSLAFGLG